MSGSVSSIVAHRIRRQAKRILAGMVRGSEQRIFPGYISFDEDRRPRWWGDGLTLESWGAVIGVHEIEPDCPRGAIVVAENGLAVFNDTLAPVWLPYEEIEGWNKLSKEPISKSLVVRTKAGNEVELLFPNGGAFAFVQFLGYANAQLHLEKSRRGRTP